MMTTVAFYQSVDPGGLDTTLNAVADPHLRTSGADIYVPSLNQLLWAAGMVSTTVAKQYARLIAPSLQRVSPITIAPTQGAAAAANLPADPHSVTFFTRGTPSLVPNETINAKVNSDPAAGQVHAVVLTLSDNDPVPVAGGEIFSVRATSATAAVAGAWTNVNLVLDSGLPVGHYQCLGMRAESTNMLAARAVVPGYAWRPGVLGCVSSSAREDFRFRRGELGVLFEFDEVTLFTIDVLAAGADAAQVFYFDLIKVS